VPLRRHLDGSQHAERYLVDVGDLVHERQGIGEAVRDQDAVVALDDAGLDLHARFYRPPDDAGGHLEIVLLRHDDHHRLIRGRVVRFVLVQVADVDGSSDADAFPARRARVVAHHGGLGDDGFCDGLHRHVADDRGSLV
jgi:hypothetical protein